MRNANNLFSKLSDKSKKALIKARKSTNSNRPCFNVPKEVFNKQLYDVTQENKNMCYKERIKLTRKIIDKKLERNILYTHFSHNKLKYRSLDDNHLRNIDLWFDDLLWEIGIKND